MGGGDVHATEAHVVTCILQKKYNLLQLMGTTSICLQVWSLFTKEVHRATFDYKSLCRKISSLAMALSLQAGGIHLNTICSLTLVELLLLKSIIFPTD